MQPVDSVTFEEAKAKLKWGAEGEFSASLKPAECRALLERLNAVAVLKVSDVLIHPGGKAHVHQFKFKSNGDPYIVGDPGDETDAR